MAVLIFSLRNVPDEEADAIRRLLEQHRVEFYETTAGSWGTSTPAIWLKNDEDADIARELIERFQENHSAAVRAEYESLKAEGRHRRFGDVLREKPLQVILYVLFAAFLLYISIKPFFDFGR
ncbi:MAG: DUF6164 family protein [Pseudomonadota bacterium]